MFALQVILVTLYTGFLVFILLYSIMQANLVYNYLRDRKKRFREDVLEVDTSSSEVPFVTVQLPIFNEKYVVERLIDAVADFDYPRDRFEVQVLDDSTDETLDISRQKVEEKRAEGLDIKLVTRPDRQGFKAGALAYGMEQAKGDFIAIFDADFVPKRAFLQRTMPYFTDPNIGVVQTRWEHINRDYSILTRLQAFGLDAHFSVEQAGRNHGGHFINFNGTAGVWRKITIEDAGGWEADTLTEDLDLSYRAQVKGWRFKFLENVGSPAELPAAMNALKTQQFRWTKGAAECARKNLPRVLRTKDIPLSTKLHASFHLLNSFLFICIIGTALLSVPMLFIKDQLTELEPYFRFGGIFLVSTVLLSIFYWVSASNEYENKLKGFLVFILKFPLFLSMSMGLSLHNAIAVVEGYIGKKTPFIRTPKFNIQKNEDSWHNNKYLTRAVDKVALMEAALALYFLAAVIIGVMLGDWGLLPFHVMLFLGFAVVSFFSFNHSRLTARKA